MFNIAFIIVSILLVIVILLQQKHSGLGALMGGSGEEIAQTRRGADKFLHQATVVLATLFICGGFYAMFWAV
jgi:protein translocase SecG subunit